MGHAVAQLAEALDNKPGGREFYSWWIHNPSCCTTVLAPNQSLTEISTMSISGGDKGNRYVGLTILPLMW